MTDVSLTAVPAGASPRSVVAAPAVHRARASMEVRLAPEVERFGVPGVDYVDQPTFLELPVVFSNGTLDVAIASQVHDAAPEYARGFAGIAFNISDDPTTFEAVYLRPENGRSLMRDAPRNGRAVQYFSYPDWPFDRLRNERPDAGYESGADIRPGEWSVLHVELSPIRLTAVVNGEVVLEVDRLGPPSPVGRLGLFVDIGTVAWFEGLKVVDSSG